MFAYLQGTVAETELDSLVLDVGGVGYELNSLRATLAAVGIGKQAKLFIHFHMAQDILALYGFISKEERALFRQLISVTRVGPKAALSAISALGCEALAAAIVTEDVKALSRVSGLGTKTAQRIILELQEKIAKETAFADMSDISSADNFRQEAVAALHALGYDPSTAARAVAAVSSDAQGVEELIKQSLKQLARF